MKDNIRNHVTGDVRIMNRAWIENERISPLQFFVNGTDSILYTLNATPGIALATPRTETMVSIYRSGEQIPCRSIGIDFVNSRIMKGVNNRVIAGSVPDPESGGALVSKGLADELKLKVGDRFTAISRTAISGSNGKTFSVAGIISMADTDFTGRVFFIDWRTASQYLRMGGNALEIQVFLDRSDEAERGAGIVKAALSAASVGGSATDAAALDIRPWHKVSGMNGFLEIAGIIYAIYGAIFYVLASTVIFNTTMMSVLERKREIGTLGALGMARGRIVSLFLSESALIAFVGTVAGLIVGGILVAVWAHFGFDIEAIYGTDMKGFGYSRVVYPSLKPMQYVFIFFTGIAISVAACWIPARMAAKVEPVDALADR
jgi:putative ABC transport system permease protein